MIRKGEYLEKVSSDERPFDLNRSINGYDRIIVPSNDPTTRDLDNLGLGLKSSTGEKPDILKGMKVRLRLDILDPSWLDLGEEVIIEGILEPFMKGRKDQVIVVVGNDGRHGILRPSEIEVIKQ